MWALNVFLYLMFLSSPAYYEAFKASGAPCFAYISDHGEAPATEEPVCFYDPKEK